VLKVACCSSRPAVMVEHTTTDLRVRAVVCSLCVCVCGGGGGGGGGTAPITSAPAAHVCSDADPCTWERHTHPTRTCVTRPAGPAEG
jgi:hypothetical protein